MAKMAFPQQSSPKFDRLLAPYAASDATSRGRVYEEPAPDWRGEFQRDRDRIIHCAAFRRLEYKTQVFVNHEGDMFRTRLTHSIEVAQIARTIARALSLNEDLTEAIALAHDLGHAPFGHAGQESLNCCMREYGGFEHNLQSLRVVEVLEEHYASFPGLNLSFETREGILKHCARASYERVGEAGERFREGGQPSLEAQVADLADEIAYNNHDLDDGLRAGLIEVEELQEIALFREPYLEVRRVWPELSQRGVIHEVIRHMVNRQVCDLIETSRDLIASVKPADIDAVRQHDGGPLICFESTMRAAHRELKRYLGTHLYRHYRVHRMTTKAKRTLKALFEAFMADLQVLPPTTRSRVQALQQADGEAGKARGIVDYIAGMTDRYAIAEYERLFTPSQLT